MLSILGYHSGVEDQTNENADNPVNIPNLLDVSNYLLSISPSSFEQIISEFMKSMGYPIVKVIGTTGDGGIDIICSKSNSPDDNETIAVQCKRFRGNVGVKIAREFLGALQDNNVQNGFLITTGDFTKDCSALCQRSGKIKTINGSELSKYMIQFGLYQKFRHGLRQSAETR